VRKHQEFFLGPPVGGAADHWAIEVGRIDRARALIELGKVVTANARDKKEAKIGFDLVSKGMEVAERLKSEVL